MVKIWSNRKTLSVNRFNPIRYMLNYLIRYKIVRCQLASCGHEAPGSMLDLASCERGHPGGPLAGGPGFPISTPRENVGI
jgi:hypothetical protein